MLASDQLLRPSDAVHFTLVGFSLVFFVVGVYYRVQSEKSGERLDRTKEGWPILISIRLLGLLIVVSAVTWLCKPSLFAWASVPIRESVRWIGVAGFACSVVWLLWMFRTLWAQLDGYRRDAP